MLLTVKWLLFTLKISKNNITGLENLNKAAMVTSQVNYKSKQIKIFVKKIL